MIPIERHQRILALVEQRGAVSINELTEILGVSHMTIRRDVSKLEEQGLLVSVSGGVRAVSRLAAEPSHLVKSTLQSEEKQAIGALAASHIAKNSCIYLDAGTTTLALARAILDRNDLPSRALTILFSVGNADCLLVAIQTAPEISKVRLFLIFFQIKRMDFFLVQ